MIGPWRAAASACIAATAATLSACAVKVGPEHRPPAFALPDAYGPAVASLGPAAVAAQPWWRGFDDAALHEVVERALARNPDVAAAAARLDEALALIDAAEAGLRPSIGLQAAASVQERLAGDDARTTRSGSAGDGGDAELSLILGWAPDLFGGGSRAVEAAEAEARRRDALRRDLERATAAAVARSYVDDRLATARLGLLETALSLQQRTLQIVRVRREAGLASELDVNRALADLAAAQARRGPLLAARAAARHALAVLAGAPPRGLELPQRSEASGIPSFDAGPDPGVPRELLRRRPDLVAAEANLARSTAEIGVAESRLHPTLSLPGSLSAGVSGIGSGNVVGGIVAGVSAVLDLPLFDAGARRAQVRAAEARAQEALRVYERTLLGALQQAETALAAVDGAKASGSHWSDAVGASERAFEQADTLYREGLSGFLDVLEAQRTLIANRDSLAASQSDLARALIDFHAAVASDWR